MIRRYKTNAIKGDRTPGNPIEVVEPEAMHKEFDDYRKEHPDDPTAKGGVITFSFNYSSNFRECIIEIDGPEWYHRIVEKYWKPVE